MGRVLQRAEDGDRAVLDLVGVRATLEQARIDGDAAMKRLREEHAIAIAKKESSHSVAIAKKEARIDKLEGKLEALQEKHYSN